MPSRIALGLAIVVLLAACGGGDEQTSVGADPLLTEQSFTQIVAAEVSKAPEVAAEAGDELTVRAEEGLNWVEAPVSSEYAEYLETPDRRDELVGGASERILDALAVPASERELAAIDKRLMPVLKPPFQLRRLPLEPLRQDFAGNVDVIYAVDDGDSFKVVTPRDVDRWGEDLGEIHRIAVKNLVSRTPELTCEQELCGWSTGDGYDATRLISEELRRDITDEIGPAVYAIPQTNVFVALPRRLADEIRGTVLEQFTRSDEPLSPDVFVEDGGRVVVLPG